MRKQDLTVKKALKICKLQSQAQSEVKTWESGSAETVNKVWAKDPSHDDNRRFNPTAIWRAKALFTIATSGKLSTWYETIHSYISLCLIQDKANRN